MPFLRPTLGATLTYKLDCSNDGANDRRREQGCPDIFENIRFQPTDDRPALEVREHGFTSKTKKASKEKRGEEELRVHFQCAGCQNTGCEGKRRRDQIQYCQSHRAFFFDAS